MNLSLYTLSSEYLHALNVLQGGDHSPEAIRDTLDALREPVEEKCGQVMAYTLNLEAEADAIKQVSARLDARRKALEAKAEHLRDYTLAAMQSCGIKEIAGPDNMFKVAVRNNPEKVELDDSLITLPAEFWREKITREPNKTAILAALKADTIVPCARIIRTQRLEVK